LAWYSGGWNDAVAGHPDPLFQFHHQPFNYFAPYAEGARFRAEHLKDIEDLLAALRTGNPPAVAFVKPIGADNEHPGYADLLRGQQYVATLVKAVQDSAVWKDSVIIITYDEGGGRWDHVRRRGAIAGVQGFVFRPSLSRLMRNAASSITRPMRPLRS